MFGGRALATSSHRRLRFDAKFKLSFLGSYFHALRDLREGSGVGGVGGVSHPVAPQCICLKIQRPKLHRLTTRVALGRIIGSGDSVHAGAARFVTRIRPKKDTKRCVLFWGWIHPNGHVCHFTIFHTQLIPPKE